MGRAEGWTRECLIIIQPKRAEPEMSNELIANERSLHEEAVTTEFLETPNEDSFADLFKTFTPQLVAFLRARSCDLALAEDLAQEVMFTVYRKASQLRDRRLFRAWLFKIARNILCRHHGKQSREMDTIDLADVADRSVAGSHKPAAMPAFEFMQW